MTRFLATIAALALMLPATAEAAKFRGGRSAKAEKPASRSTLIVAPGLAGAAAAAAANTARQVPLPHPERDPAAAGAAGERDRGEEALVP